MSLVRKIKQCDMALYNYPFEDISFCPFFLRLTFGDLCIVSVVGGFSVCVTVCVCVRACIRASFTVEIRGKDAGTHNIKKISRVL